jgi:hypothetical protein
MCAEFCVYRVRAKPGKGHARRCYVGTVQTWGLAPKDAVDARVDQHMEGGKQAAAWLKPCRDPEEPVVLAECATLEGALEAELYYTLVTMAEHGALLTRGGPYCQIKLPWEEVTPVRQLATNRTLPEFRKALRTAKLPKDVRLHLEGRCYKEHRRQ